MDKTAKIKNFCRLGNSLRISKKAQGIEINVIIIAAIALIVLVVLIAIFTGRLSIFTKGMSDAQAKAEQTALKFEYGSNCVPKVKTLQNAFTQADADKSNNLDAAENAAYTGAKATLANNCKEKLEADCIGDCLWVP